jgi:hypothetical protein
MKQSNTLTIAQRKMMQSSTYTPRAKEENEALPITFTQSELNEIPKMEPVRHGASDHMKIGRVGVFC